MTSFRFPERRTHLKIISLFSDEQTEVQKDIKAQIRLSEINGIQKIFVSLLHSHMDYRNFVITSKHLTNQEVPFQLVGHYGAVEIQYKKLPDIGK